jgi:hypothetical protein
MRIFNLLPIFKLNWANSITASWEYLDKGSFVRFLGFLMGPLVHIVAGTTFKKKKDLNYIPLW